MSTPGKHPDLTLGRIEAFLKHKHLLSSKLYSEKQSESVSLKSWAAPGRITFQEAVSHIAEFKDVKDGQEFGPPWATHWFFVKLEIPQEWKGEEVHFLFDCGSAESLVWSEAGVPLCAMNGSTGDDRRANFILEKEAKPGSRSFWLELACNGLFGNSQWEVGPTQPDPNIKFNLKEAQIVRCAKLCAFLLVRFRL
jgi:alpha-mannosidase